MAVNVVYDSGSGGVDADVWGSWLLSARLTPQPREVMISINPIDAPSATWNLAGYACIRSVDTGIFFVAEQTPIPLLGSDSSPVWTVLADNGLNRSGAALVDVYGVYWNINRWVGKSRVRVAVRTV